MNHFQNGLIPGSKLTSVSWHKRRILSLSDSGQTHQNSHVWQTTSRTWLELDHHCLEVCTGREEVLGVASQTGQNRFLQYQVQNSARKAVGVVRSWVKIPLPWATALRTVLLHFKIFCSHESGIMTWLKFRLTQMTRDKWEIPDFTEHHRTSDWSRWSCFFNGLWKIHVRSQEFKSCLS